MNFNTIFTKNPNIDKSKRKEIWRFLEKKYLPHRKYGDNSFLDRGCWWFKQGHIFKKSVLLYRLCISSNLCVTILEKNDSR